MPIVKSDIPNLLTAGLKATFFEAYNASLEAMGDWRRIATVVNSTKDTETYAWLGSIPKMQEFLDERQIKGLLEHEYTLKNRTYESTLGVKRTAIEDDQYGQIMIRVRQMGDEAARHDTELVFSLLAAAFSTACYDGQYLCDDDHSEGESGTQSNKGTSALSDSTLKTAIIAMRKFKDDTGKVMGIIPDLLVVGPDLMFTARKILESQYEAGGDLTNDTNTLKGVLDLMVTPMLTDTDDWFVLSTKGIVRPIIYQNRVPLEFEQREASSDTGFMRDEYLYGTRKRCSVGCGLWQMIYGASV